jgi:hypothetical protein
MKKILDEDIFQYIIPHIISKFQEKITFRTQDGEVSELLIIDTTESAVKGITGNLWIDDIDTIIKEHNENVITKAIMITRSNTKLRLVFTSNMGQGAYITLKNVFAKHEDIIDCISLEHGDVEHLDMQTDEFLYDVATALSGKAEADAQLRNIANREGLTFMEENLREAIDRYEDIRGKPFVYDVVCMGIDPSGTGHEFGFSIWAWYKKEDFVFELLTGKRQMGEVTQDGKKLELDDIMLELMGYCDRFHVQKIFIEPNSSGPAMRIKFENRGYKAFMLGWGGKSKVKNHQTFINLACHFFDNYKIAMKNQELYLELIKYNPELGTDENKGNMADAFLLCLWGLVGGIKYLQNLEKQRVGRSGRRSVGLSA